MMQWSLLEGQVEVLTRDHNVYISREGSKFILDVLDAVIKDKHIAHIESVAFDSWDEMLAYLSRVYGISLSFSAPH